MQIQAEHGVRRSDGVDTSGIERCDDRFELAEQGIRIRTTVEVVRDREFFALGHDRASLGQQPLSLADHCLKLLRIFVANRSIALKVRADQPCNALELAGVRVLSLACKDLVRCHRDGLGLDRNLG